MSGSTSTSPSALPPPHYETTLAGCRGVTLHLEGYWPAAGRPASALVVLVHGYSSHVGLYRHVGAALAEAGLAVTAFDCRGHGRSTGRRGHTTRFDDYLQDLVQVVEQAQALARQRQGDTPLPLFLLGHSHGAVIALDAVLAGRVQAARLVLAAPWFALQMQVPWWKLRLGTLTSRLWPTLAMANGIRPEDVSRNPAVTAGFWTDPLVHHVATSRWFQEATAAQRRILAAAASLSVPTLALLAGEDRIVVNDTTRALAAAAPRFIRLHHFEGLFHEIFLEPEWPAVVEEVRKFFCSPLPEPSDRPGLSPTVPVILSART